MEMESVLIPHLELGGFHYAVGSSSSGCCSPLLDIGPFQNKPQSSIKSFLDFYVLLGAKILAWFTLICKRYIVWPFHTPE